MCATFPHEPGDESIDVSDEDLAAMDWSEFDPTGIEIPQSLKTANSTLDIMVGGQFRGADQLSLFTRGRTEFTPASELSTDRLWAVVVRAYADVRQQRSIDFVIADPELNARFIRRCWELGAASASPFDLNWMLLNSRKNKRVQSVKLPRPEIAGMKREYLDQFAYAADIAMRRLQDRLYREQREASIDCVLCDPHLARDFDRLAHEFVPGFTSFELRWAAISLRKARRTRSAASAAIEFEPLGRVEDLRVASIPAVTGLYAISSGATSLFVGVAQNVRSQVDALIQTLGSTVSPAWLEPSHEKPTIQLLRQPIQSAEMARSFLLRSNPSRLNHKHYGLFVA